MDYSRTDLTSEELFKLPDSKPPADNGAATAKRGWRIALAANVKGVTYLPEDGPPDAGAEFDSQQTIAALTTALEADGHYVHLCQADQTLPETLINLRPHFVFNIAEGIGGDAREAQVPALCELLRIPYTGSRVLANAIALDKVLTKRIWQTHGLPTAPFQSFTSVHEPLIPALTFPLFIKPSSEGTGMGMGPSSIVHDDAMLRRQVAWVLDTYRQPALAEPYLPGREFTVGFIGNPGARTGRRRPWLYDDRGYHFFPVLELDSSQSITPNVYGVAAKALDIEANGAPRYLCPADVAPALAAELVELTRLAADALDVCDVGRVDFRLDAQGRPMLLEINTLPGLNPRVSDLCIMAAADGMSYDALITEILYMAAERQRIPYRALLTPLVPASFRPATS